MTNAAGIALIVAPGKRALFLKRGPYGDHPGTWCFPGGMSIEGESADQTVRREVREETGHDVGDRPLIECGSVPITDADGRYTLFATQADTLFAPTLNDESTGFAWAPLDDPPQPVHPGLAPSLPTIASDAEGGFKEEDHPRRDDGKFGSGGGGGEGEPKSPSEAPNEAAAGPETGSGHAGAKGGAEGTASAEGEQASSQEGEGELTPEESREQAKEMWLDSPGDVEDTLGTWDGPAEMRGPIEDREYEISDLADNIDTAVDEIAEITDEDRAGLEDGESFQADADLLEHTEAMAAKASETRKSLVATINEVGRIIGAEPVPEPDDFNVVDDMTPKEARALATAVTAIKDAVDSDVDTYDLALSNFQDSMADEDDEFETTVERATEVRDALEAVIKTIRKGIAKIEKVMAPAVARQDKRDEEFYAEWEKKKAFREGKDAAPAAADQALAFDRAPPLTGAQSRGAPLPRGGLAFDRGSVRSYDDDGRLRVAITNISKANICPYRGDEIPGYEELGLDGNKVYQLFRAPDELEKAAPSFNNLPLLSEHVAVTADDHQPDLVIGATGSDADFSAPFLRNSLIIWARQGIEDVEDETKKELSCAYRYRPDMTPGEFNGARYDGVMRDIKGNHVALVKEGRAGTDVVVGDGKPNLKEIGTMATLARTTTVKAMLAHGAILGFLLPKIAKDQKLDAKPIAAALGGVSAKTFKAARPKILEAIKAATKGKLAKDASIDGVAQLLDMIEAHKSAGADADPMPVKEPDTAETAMEEVDDALPGFLKGKLSEDDYNEAMKLHKPAAKDNDPKLTELGAADKDDDDKKDDDKDKDPAKDGDEPPPFEGEPKRGGGKGANDAMITKPAMDAAIKSAVIAANKTQAEIREAERAVRPWVGDMAIAFDSAADVYKGALDALGVDVKDVHHSAYKTILGMQPKPGQGKPQTQRIATDAAAVDSFEKMFPEAARL